MPGTFKKYPSICPQRTHQVKWGQIVSELTMNSQCTLWVSDPLPPVPVTILVLMYTISKCLAILVAELINWSQPSQMSTKLSLFYFGIHHALCEQ